MTTETTTEIPTAYVRYFRKSHPAGSAQYDMHEASISLPLDAPNGADQDFLGRAAQVLADLKFEVWTALGVQSEVVDGVLVEKPQTPTPAPSGNRNGGSPPPAKPATATGAAQPDQRCGVCGGDTFNNTAPGAKRNERGPDYKCKDKACGAAMWTTGKNAENWVQ